MSRLNLSILWLILLFVPASAVAQRADGSKSRSRTETRRVEVKRSVKSAKVAEKRESGQRNDRARLREGKTGERRSDRAASRNRVKRRAAAKRRHRISHVKRRHVRHHRQRYVYRQRRYHRHGHGISIGFYIRIPTIHWHIGHSRRFVYRQIVSGHAAGDVEVISTFRRKIRGVHREYVEVEFELDRIEVASRGRFIGVADHIPGGLRKMRAKIYRDGFVHFDRMLYVVGNDYAGFEMLSTRYCGGELARASYNCLEPRSGDIDFHDERVHSTGHSELLGLARSGRAVPIALVPDEEYLGFQYVVGYGRSSDGYYSGSFDYSSLSSYDADGTASRILSGPNVASFDSGQANWVDDADDAGFAHESVVSYLGENGAPLELQRRTQIHSLED